MAGILQQQGSVQQFARQERTSPDLVGKHKVVLGGEFQSAYTSEKKLRRCGLLDDEKQRTGAFF